MVDWGKFKSSAKGGQLTQAKNSYIKFCKMLDEVGFELVSDYIGNKEKVELVYKLDDIRLSISPNNFKTSTYKAIINFKNKLKENNDKFIKFSGLTSDINLIAKIRTYDDTEINIDVRNYDSWNKGRQDFYNKLKEIGGYAESCYKGNKEKMNIFIGSIKLNSMEPCNFKTGTYKSIINIKNQLIENGDEFVKFVGLTEGGKLIIDIKTFDKGEVNIDIAHYNSWNKGRQDTYNYCKEREYKILSPYISDKEKILIDFNCGHEPNWISPNNLKKDTECPVCSESKGEKIIRQYLENNNIAFVQEYRFDDCKHKRSLPFDFYIPKYNLCIEFDGEQHYKAYDYFGGENVFKDTKIRDEIKNKYCKENEINLLRIPYWELDNVEDILNKEFERLNL